MNAALETEDKVLEIMEDFNKIIATANVREKTIQKIIDDSHTKLQESVTLDKKEIEGALHYAASKLMQENISDKTLKTNKNSIGATISIKDNCIYTKPYKCHARNQDKITFLTDEPSNYKGFFSDDFWKLVLDILTIEEEYEKETLQEYRGKLTEEDDPYRWGRRYQYGKVKHYNKEIELDHLHPPHAESFKVCKKESYGYYTKHGIKRISPVIKVREEYGSYKFEPEIRFEETPGEEYPLKLSTILLATQETYEMALRAAETINEYANTRKKKQAQTMMQVWEAFAKHELDHYLVAQRI